MARNKKKRKPAAKVKSWLLLLILAVIGANLWWWHSRSAPPRETAGRAALPATGKTRRVRLFFATPQGELAAEERDIPPDPLPALEAKRVINEMVKGPGKRDLYPVLPPQSKLQALYLDATGCAYLDFSRELKSGHPGGTQGELLTVAALVKTLCDNFAQINRVQFLIEGKEIETLTGHLDLRHPLGPQNISLDAGKGQ